MPPPTNKTSFNTMDVRSWEKPQHSNSKDITETVHSTTPPMCINWLDVGCQADLRIQSYIDSVATDPKAKVKGVVHIDSSKDTVLYSAGCTWLDVCKHDRDFQFGTYAASDLGGNSCKSSPQISFDRPYAKQPKMVVWIQDLDVSNSDNCRIKTYASNVTTTGFTLNVETWGNTKVNSAKVTWVAHPASRSNIASGEFHTNADRTSYKQTEKKEHSQDVNFETFEGIPDVYVGFYCIDTSKGYNLRLKTFAKDVSAKGMKMCIDTWFDTVLWQAGASWLAVQSC
ncbi:hypothetical protein BDV93DRAFT_565266 [Ceratobasidium sp. AG-I]|nr:hypothetical protein BDV93DRAFT_565266 [Ceratobasidium sp. AG-I]